MLIKTLKSIGFDWGGSEKFRNYIETEWVANLNGIKYSFSVYYNIDGGVSYKVYINDGLSFRLVAEGEENILEYFKDYIRDSKLKKLGI